VSAHTRHSVIIATRIGVSIHNKQKAGNKMEIVFQMDNEKHCSLDELAEFSHDIYIVNRDAPEGLGGASVSLYVQMFVDSYGEPQFGLLPQLREIIVVNYDADDDEDCIPNTWFGSWGGGDTFVLMGKAVNLALDISRAYLKHDRNIYVINESGTTESTMCSVYSYMAERGFPF
jgi:hypothetical protein